MRIGSPFVTRATFGRMPLMALTCAAVMSFFVPVALEAQGRGNLTQAERLRMQAEAERAFQAEIEMERPIPALNTIWIEEMKLTSPPVRVKNFCHRLGDLRSTKLSMERIGVNDNKPSDWTT